MRGNMERIAPVLFLEQLRVGARWVQAVRRGLIVETDRWIEK